MEDILAGTNDDALQCKLSSVQVGYLSDPFVNVFLGKTARKPPIINRGTFTRTVSIDLILSHFAAKECQVVSLGAGSDTRPFRFASSNIVKYIELDFMQVCATKIRKIVKAKLVSDPVVTRGGSQLASNNYCLYPCDLRNWTQIELFLKSTLNLS